MILLGLSRLRGLNLIGNRLLLVLVLLLGHGGSNLVAGSSQLLEASLRGGHGLITLRLSREAQLEEGLEHDVLEVLGLFPAEWDLDGLEVDLIVVAIFLLTSFVIGVEFVDHVTLLVSERRLKDHLEGLLSVTVKLFELSDATLLFVSVGVEDSLRSCQVELVEVLLDSLTPDAAFFTLGLLFLRLSLLKHVSVVVLKEHLRLVIVVEVQLRQVEVVGVDDDVGDAVAIELLEANVVLYDERVRDHYIILL